MDADDTPGQSLLTGSAGFLTVPTLSESLAGRAVFFELWPFSRGELRSEPDGGVIGIEVKSGLTVTGKSFAHLAHLRDRMGDAFVHGYVLSFNPDPLPFGDRLTALPISYLWQAG
nr:hypothetical protein GCM10020093_089050 [Planobispora longispora]